MHGADNRHAPSVGSRGGDNVDNLELTAPGINYGKSAIHALNNEAGQLYNGASQDNINAGHNKPTTSAVQKNIALPRPPATPTAYKNPDQQLHVDRRVSSVNFDKPLPAFPMHESPGRPAQAFARALHGFGIIDGKATLTTATWTPRISTQNIDEAPALPEKRVLRHDSTTSVRRVRSYGDLLSSSNAPRVPSTWQGSSDMSKSLSAGHSLDVHPTPQQQATTQMRALTKRASSALLRRPSSANLMHVDAIEHSRAVGTETAQTAAVAAAPLSVSFAIPLDDQSTTQQTPSDNVSHNSRMRRRSSFFGLPAFLRGKPKDVALHPQAGNTAHSMEQLGSNLLDNDAAHTRNVLQNSTERHAPHHDQAHSPPHTPPVASPSVDKSGRRFFSIPSFFRSASASSTPVHSNFPSRPVTPDNTTNTTLSEQGGLVGNRSASQPISIPRLPSLDTLFAPADHLDHGMFGHGATGQPRRNRADTAESAQSVYLSAISSSPLRESSLPSDFAKLENSDVEKTFRLGTSVSNPYSPNSSMPASPAQARSPSDRPSFVRSRSSNSVSGTHSPSSPAAAPSSPSPLITLTPSLTAQDLDATVESPHLLESPKTLELPEGGLYPSGPSVRFSIGSRRGRAGSMGSSSPTQSVVIDAPSNTSGAKAVAMLKLRRRANTAGSSFFGSTSSSPVSPSDPDTLEARTMRNVSSSRLSALFSPQALLAPLSSPSPLLDGLQSSVREDNGSVIPERRSFSPGNRKSGSRSRSTSNADQKARGTVIHPAEGDTPAVYLERLRNACPISEVGGLLASVADNIHTSTLTLFMQDFSFDDIPIDIALRQLLLKVRLPQETQQIDRLMQAFAERYNECNPKLFTSPDQPYILAFSMIMLHTDAFNKSNKRKMSRADYVRNTTIEGISPNLLIYIYDNILATPFVYADAELDHTGTHVQRGVEIASPSNSVSLGSSLPLRSKVNVYQLMAAGELPSHRIDISSLIPYKNPFTYSGTVSFFDCSALHRRYLQAKSLDISSLHPATLQPPNDTQTVAMVKTGLLDYKDDLAEGGKKASGRKWKTCSVILTPQHLLIYHNRLVSTLLQEQLAGGNNNIIGQNSLALSPDIDPDAIYPLKSTIGLYDYSYKKYPHAFRFLRSDGSQILFRAADNDSLNDWIALVNYGATLSTAAVPLRSHQSAATPGTTDDSATRPLVYKAATVLGPVLPRLGTEPEGEVDELGCLSNATKGSAVSTTIFGAPHELRNTAKPTSRTSREVLITAYVTRLETEIEAEQGELAICMRDVKLLSILVPLTQATRQRLMQAVLPAAQRVNGIRQTIVKLVCYRECLRRELLAAKVVNRKPQVDTNEAMQDGLSTSTMLERATSGDEIRTVRCESLSIRRSLTANVTENGSVHFYASVETPNAFGPLAMRPHSPLISPTSFTTVQERFDEVSDDDLYLEAEQTILA